MYFEKFKVLVYDTKIFSLMAVGIRSDNIWSDDFCNNLDANYELSILRYKVRWVDRITSHHTHTSKTTIIDLYKWDYDKDNDFNWISKTTFSQTPSFSKFNHMIPSGNNLLPSMEVLGSTSLAVSNVKDTISDPLTKISDSPNDNFSWISETTLGRTPSFSEFDHMLSSDDASLSSIEVLGSTLLAVSDIEDRVSECSNRTSNLDNRIQNLSHDKPDYRINFPIEISDSQAKTLDFSEVNNSSLRDTNTTGKN